MEIQSHYIASYCIMIASCCNVCCKYCLEYSGRLDHMTCPWGFGVLELGLGVLLEIVVLACCFGSACLATKKMPRTFVMARFVNIHYLGPDLLQNYKSIQYTSQQY